VYFETLHRVVECLEAVRIGLPLPARVGEPDPS
jgi:hypothetical protein